MLRRTLLLSAVCGGLAFIVLICRLWVVQIKDGEHYQTLALSQQLRSISGGAVRGDIYDRNGKPLAVSATVENVYVCPEEMRSQGESAELIASGLAEILGLDYNDILLKVTESSSWYVTIAKKLEHEDADKVRHFKSENSLSSIRLETDVKRYYPNCSLACHILGFVGADNTGLEGIEARYDDVLTGDPASVRRLTNAFGSRILNGSYEDYLSGTHGSSITTTIDETVQYFAEKHLRQAVEDYDIQNGAGAIVMNVNTGEILAMASSDNYDPNDFLTVSAKDREKIFGASSSEEADALLRAAQQKQWRNKALSDTYEPGSTFKIITLAMALEEGIVDLNSSFYCSGSVSVPGRTQPVRCWKTEGHGSQDLTKAVQHSCNSAFVNIGLRVGAETFYNYCEAFGLLELNEDMDAQLSAKTGIDISGESGSIWWSRNTFLSEKNLSQLAAASFGQTFTVTPLQLITAVSACVNGGKLMKPYIVSEITDEDGNIIIKKEPQTVRQVISEQTSKTVREILEQVVGDDKEGTGRNAAVSGYRLGGKTGTSEKITLQAQTGQKEYIVSFVGFAPANNPEIAILVFLDTPSNKSGIYISGGQMAAPVVGRMFADILPYMDILPDRSLSETAESEVPELAGKDLDGAAAALTEAGLRFRTIGSGSLVTAQLPLPGTVIAKDSEVILYFNAAPSEDKETVPDLSGLTYEQARYALSKLGLFIKTFSTVSDSSAQIVASQSISAGYCAEHGFVITVSLIDSDENLLGRY